MKKPGPEATVTSLGPMTVRMRAQAVPPPKHLSAASKAWWRSVLDTYVLEPHHVHLLRCACESMDRMNQAREALAQHGLTFMNSDGEPRTRPEVQIERDSRLAFARLVRELDLDVEAPLDRSRPPPLRSNRG
jgi:P27 family predicted phage terminase small subunit